MYGWYQKICILKIVLFQLAAVWLTINEVYFIKHYKEEYMTPNDFCLQLKNFPLNLTKEELCVQILE